MLRLQRQGSSARLPASATARSATAAAIPTNGRWVLLGLSLGAALAVASPARGGSSGFLCPSSGRLISVGAPAEEVRRRCREPDDVQHRVELRTVRETRRVWTNGIAQEVEVQRTVEIPIEEWFFDFGPTRFTKTLRFETGRLVHVDEGGKGTVGGG